MRPNPPHIAMKFLRWFCKEDCIEEVEGDLVEVYEHHSMRSHTKAKWQFYWNVIKHFRPEFIKVFSGQNSNSTAMFRHNLLLTIRHFKNSKTPFTINFLSLFIGFSCSLLIYLWIMDEMKMDKFHSNNHQLIQVLQNDVNPNDVSTEPYTPGILAEVLTSEFAFVDHATSVVPYEWFEGEKLLLSNDRGEIFTSKNQFASNDYFKVFSFEMLHGNKEKVFEAYNSVVITDEMAMKLYGRVDAIGESLKWISEDFGGTYQVTGVIKEPPVHSTIQFDAVFPYAIFMEENEDLSTWNNSDPYTYLRLSDQSSLADLNSALTNFLEAKSGNDKQSLFGQVFTERYLYDSYENGIPVGGRISYVKLFSFIALFILIVAVINFINMTTAEATNRMKEIGVKKAIGIHRTSLIHQFLIESLLISIFALIASIALLYFILPEFNVIAGKQITLSLDLNLVMTVISITLTTAILAGLYPAFYLSGFSSIKALKGVASKGKKAHNLRRGLVGFQFTISAVFIFATIVIYQQIEYIQSKNLGFDKENIIWFTSGIPATEGELESLTEEDIESLLARLKNISGVMNATNFAQNIVGEYGATTGLSWEGKNPDQRVLFANFSVGYDFIKTLDINMMLGRSFSRDFKTDHEKIIFNKAAIEAMGLADPIGKTVELWDQQREIIGVVENFHIASLHEDILPTFIKLDINSFAANIMVKLNPGNQRRTIEQISRVYKDFFLDGMPFDFSFLDDNYQHLYENEIKTSSLSKYAAVIAIVISCLGLFGFANFMVNKRLREVGIRKVLGASRLRIIRLVTVEFNMIVLVSLLIAIPTGYFLLNSWLSEFAFRINLTIWQVLGGTLVVMLSSWVTVTAQTLRAVNVNPVECLKDE